MRAFVKTLTSLGPFGILILSALDSAGIPLPAAVDALLVVLAVNDPKVAYLSAALAVLGSAAGTMVLYSIARKGGQAYLGRHAATPREQRFREWFGRYGMITVFVPAISVVPPMPLKPFVVFAGVFGVRPALFLPVIVGARIIRYFGLAYLGSQLGHDALAYLKAHWAPAVGLSLLITAAMFGALRLVERPVVSSQG